MSYSPLISNRSLHDRLGDPDLAIVDCRFSLADTAAGDAGYRSEHILDASTGRMLPPEDSDPA